ncbi:N-acetylated-alpha-linked acidic dipeptidase 2, partial [Plakobranchus ocellatus]
ALYNVQWFALYHTEYEVFDIYKSQFDRDFKCLQAVARVSAEVTRSLADSLLLPLGLSDYSQGLHDIYHTLDNDYGAILRENLRNFDQLQKTISQFSEDVQEFEKRVEKLDTKK